MSAVERVPTAQRWGDDVVARVSTGQRLAALTGSAARGGTRLAALLAHGGQLDLVETVVPAGSDGYPSLAERIPGALWYEREIHDLFGLAALGRPRLDPLLLPLAAGTPRPRPGARRSPATLIPEPAALPGHVEGPGVFTIPYGPVRSGVCEAVEYLVEGPGEDIQHVRVRVYAKHRGLEKRFEGMDPVTGVLLAERVEGVASVAHALAFAQAIERIAGIGVPPAAALVRCLYAECERIANHLHSVIGLTEAAGLAVATARFGYHKEQIMRLLGEASGSRFGRGVITPGGVHALPAIAPEQLLGRLTRLGRAVDADARALMGTPSFLDRLRGTGPIPHTLAAAHGALGPLARASGLPEDVRSARPYAAYDRLGEPSGQARPTGDVLARTQQRWAEVRDAFRLARAATDALADRPDPQHELAVPVPPDASGRAVGWAEAPQGELLYLVELAGGRLTRCKPRSASFHNMALFGPSFAGDITTDFAFIEASFGLSIAGVAG
ncbi:MAG TPA: NADH-quinone oxidoreductase subunit C [Mycobacteriales bacterium]|nr:NADH-quinone oxidoreductase subunit C [Mycobacteriales bacterium]